jgi:membrane protein
MIPAAWDWLNHQFQKAIGAHWTGRLLRVLVHEIAEDDIPGMAAEMAYNFLFAIFPLCLFLVTALGFIGDRLGLDGPVEALLRQVAPYAPPAVLDIIRGYVDSLLSTRSETFLTIGLLGTWWGAAAGVGSLMKNLNRAYDVAEARPIWQAQLIALASVLTVPPLGLALFILAVGSQALIDWLGRTPVPGPGLATLLALIRLPVLALVLLLALAALYTWLPNVRHPYYRALPGSAVATAGWLALTQAFSYYVTNFGNYNATYGTFGAAIAFLLWLYLVGMVILIGAEVNAVLVPAQRARWRPRPTPP